MIKINWKKDYQGDFICPSCNKSQLLLGVLKRGKKQFQCATCNKKYQNSCRIYKNIKVEDPLNPGLEWYTNHKIQGFICPNCNDENIYLNQINRHNKKKFRCHTCKKYQCDSIILNNTNFTHYGDKLPLVKLFNWQDDCWDLRAVNPSFDGHDIQRCNANFTEFELMWFKEKVKKYVYYLCKAEKSVKTILNILYVLRNFSRYLTTENISGFDEINRSLILDYLAKEQKINQDKLGGLRKFFTTGTLKGWFSINQDIIRGSDYPKQYRGNPDPLSSTVREQIEQNLHLLPDPIARMWLIGYFSAMRPSELALLKRDCLVREGQHWKLVWHRKKTNDYHEIPISRTIAQVVQQQDEYIQSLWGNEWDYLFCNYHNQSSTDPSQPKLEAVRKILPSHNSHPLLMGIRSLITALNIRDENGQLAKFQSKILRPTRLTELFAKGHDLSVVSAWAGHKHFATTSTYYTEVSCELMDKEAGHIQRALVNSNGHRVPYESFPKSFWEHPTAHKLELTGTHINTPIYGYCGLPLDQDCHKFRACYTCQSFAATLEKLPHYIKTRDELRVKQTTATAAGQEVLVEQFGKQADRLDEIIAGLQQEAA
jgi:integrase/transposase-like protein